MADHDKLFAFISSCEDPKALREMLKKARAQGEGDLEIAVFTKLISIVPGEAPGTLEHDFWQMVQAFEQIRTDENGRTTRLSRTRQKVGRVGVEQTLVDWATDTKDTAGFTMLIERGLPHLTGEAIVLRHADRFSPAVLEAARARLARAEGVEAELAEKSSAP